MIKKKFSLKSNSQNSFCGYYDLRPISDDGCVLVLLSKKRESKLVKLFEWNLYEDELRPISSNLPLSLQMGNRQTYILEDKYIAYIECYKSSIRGVIKNRYNKLCYFIEPYFSISKTGRYVPWDWRQYSMIRESYGFKYLFRDEGCGDINKFNFDSQKINLKSLNTKNILTEFNYSDFQKLLNTSQSFLFDHPQVSQSGKTLAFLAKPYPANGSPTYIVIWRENIGWTYLSDFTMVSHFNFDQNDRIVMFAEQRKLVSRNNKLLKKIYRRIRQFYQYFNQNNSLTSKLFNQKYFLIGLDNKIISEFSVPLKGDGHPSLNGNFFVTDSYPDYNGQCKITVSKNVFEGISSFNEIKFNYDIRFLDTFDRVDLHPKLSSNSRFICVDRLEKGKNFVDVFEIT